MCNVCDDSGWYPIINKFGATVYEIKCPECFGDPEAYSLAVAKVPIPDEEAPDA